MSKDAERPESIFPINADPRRYLINKCPFPLNTPAQYPAKQEEVVFDASKHLAQPLEIPAHIKILQSNPSAGEGCVKLVEVDTLTHERKTHVENLAYTAPFRVLSDEGVKAFHTVISNNEDLTISTPRNPKFIRALAYTSKFVRDLNECDEMLDHLSKFANVDIAPHPMVTNYSQINYGEPPEEVEDGSGGTVPAAPADVWHLDSVDYVLVIMLTEGFEGGELLVSNMDPNQAMERIRANDLPDELTSRIKYPKAGYGIFMQGCRIAHAVAPLTGGKTQRITAVNSYSSRDSFRIDRPSIYNALSQNHSKDVYDSEYLRSIAWRCRGKLDYLIENPQFEDLDRADDILGVIIDQLSLARRLMKGEESYDAPLPEDIKMEQGGFESVGQK